MGTTWLGWWIRVSIRPSEEGGGGTGVSFVVRSLRVRYIARTPAGKQGGGDER